MGYEVRTSTDGVRYGLLRVIGNADAPTLFLFAGSFQDTLLDEAGHTRLGYLLINSQPSWNIVSIDLPCHGDWQFPNTRSGLQGWYDLTTQGVDFMALLTARVACVKAQLIADGISNGAFAVAGISRGGFAALHCVQAQGLIEHAACLSPVTKLKALWEFSQWSGPDPLPLNPLILRWYGYHASISNVDDRVSTDSALQLTLATRQAQGNPSYHAKFDFHMAAPSISGENHSQIAGAPELAAAWLKNRLGL